MEDDAGGNLLVLANYWSLYLDIRRIISSVRDERNYEKLCLKYNEIISF